MALWRSSTDTELYDTGTALVSTRDIAGLGMGYGARFTVGGPIVDQFGWQVGGFWGGSFSSSGTVIDDNEDIDAVYDNNGGPGNLSFAPADSAYAATFSESSSVGGLEASGTYAVVDGVKLFFGPRWIRYQAALNTAFFEEQADFEGTTNRIHRVAISSTNDLLGVQAGVEAMFPVFDNVSFGGRAAAGVYMNYSTLSRTVRTDDPGNLAPFGVASVTSTSSATGFATSVELSPKVALAVTDNLEVSLGGTFLWLNGVDEPGPHYQGIGVDDGSGNMAADTPRFNNGVNFAGITVGLQGRF
jgi:hypothetical protein